MTPVKKEKKKIPYRGGKQGTYLSENWSRIAAEPSTNNGFAAGIFKENFFWPANAEFWILFLIFLEGKLALLRQFAVLCFLEMISPIPKEHFSGKREMQKKSFSEKSPTILLVLLFLPTFSFAPCV